MNISAMLAEKPHPIPPTARVCGPGFGCPEPSGRAENYGQAAGRIMAMLSTAQAPIPSPRIRSETGLSGSATRRALHALEKAGRVRLTVRGLTIYAEAA